MYNNMQQQVSNPYERYKQQSVMTMTQGEMLTKLYDEVIKQLSAAAMYIESKDFVAVNQAAQKVQKILTYLRETLDHKYEVSEGLDALYEYFIHRIIQANTKKDAEELLEVIPMIKELKETFVAADKSMRMQ